MVSLQGLGAWGSNLLGQASELAGPVAAAAASQLKAGVKNVNKSLKENLGGLDVGGAKHEFVDRREGQSRTVTEVSFIAEGGFGSVVKVACCRTGQEFALKKIACADGVQVASSFEAAEREAQILTTLPKHPGIIRCFGYSVDKGSNSGLVKLLLELCPGGHLLDFMDSRNGELSAKEFMEPFVQIAEAVKHLHAQRPPIQHRDLKVENVLKGADGQWKLCDFGSCSTECIPAQELSRPRMHALQEEIDKTVTMLYRPPEMADVQLNYREGYDISEQVDLWMLGCILYTLAFYRHPFQDNATPMAVFNAKYFIPAEHPMARSQKLCALVHWLLAANPKDRPTAPGLLEACQGIAKAEYSGFLGSLPNAVQMKIAQHEKLYGARKSKEPPKEWGWESLSSSTLSPAAASSPSRVSKGREAAKSSGFDLRFALSEEAPASASGGGRGYSTGGRGLPVAPSRPSADLLSGGGAASAPREGLVHSAASAPVLEDLLGFGAPSEPSRAKSAPAAGGDDLIGFADFSLAPSQVSSLPPAAGLGSSGPVVSSGSASGFGDFADFSSAPPAPSWTAFGGPEASSAAHVQPAKPTATSATEFNLLDL